ncbi:MAG: phosphatase PAP2 family protein [Hydrogenophilales bacterium]|nr:phosphatase PAP2 family protein [Hydrogenophilales bacterium]
MILPQPSATWLVITHLGSAGIMLPMLVMISAGLWLAGQQSALLTWMLAMTAGVAVVLASKIAFIGWGWGSASLNFTGISGHTMLASSVFPVWMGWLLAGPTRRFSLYGVMLGLAIGAVVGWSRLVLGAHSPSEVIVGWLLGMGISLVACKAMRGQVSFRGWNTLAAALLLLTFSPSLSGYLPTHQWEVRLALALSGHARPYVRQDLHRPALADIRSPNLTWH